jgi:hypothetical protein
MKIVIGGDNSWDNSGPAEAGVAFGGGFYTSVEPNVGFIFSNLFYQGNPDATADGIAHEAGHGFGLVHQSTYDSNGNLVYPYAPSPGDGTGPIMGADPGLRGRHGRFGGGAFGFERHNCAHSWRHQATHRCSVLQVHHRRRVGPS